jgi:hypothetical protein
VFLHEGLGSIALWKDFPRRLDRRGTQLAGWTPRPLEVRPARGRWRLLAEQIGGSQTRIDQDTGLHSHRLRRTGIPLLRRF